MILVIGDLESWEREGRPVPRMDGFRFATFAKLTGPLLEETRPEMVLSPLMGDGFDAMDIARRLVEAGFQGRYRALTDDLPDSEAVREEIREIAPDLDFDLFLIRPSLGPSG
ncbi:hypothetical protein [Rubellimicrobium aerolatum]|uniref:Uncharacterized protein n=1 Tax=Rubellimicrobium aerolatum TaxID=490979 RepID=A0ABW0S8A0_9RHOB|nr:hypothetical protein [Rubellimicrobium aerolatum]MBP1804298.1 hypothetical protein [Rubellimicrobium aerolatum]